MLQKLKNIKEDAFGVIRSYPLVLSFALIAAVFSVEGIFLSDHGFDEESFNLLKVIIVCCLGISLMFAIKMISQRIGKRYLFEILGILFLIVFYFLLPKNERRLEEVSLYFIIPTFILSHLLVSFGAFLNKEKELSFWNYNKSLFVSLFLTGVFTGILTLGILLAIAAVDNLFNFNLDDIIYPQTFFFFAIFGSSFIFLLFNKKGLKNLEKDEPYPQILEFFTQFVLIPLLIVYLIILYFYSAKILISWELPRGWVSYLILAYSVVGILALLLVYPLKEKSAKSWVKVFSKLFYYTLFPLLILLFIAINTRILEYGYTEPRYFVLLLAIWLTTVVFYFIFIKKASIKFIPISLFLFGAFALVFPYFNAFSVAKRSQKHELESILENHQLLKNGQIDFNKKVNSNIVNDIADKFSFLAEREQQNYLLKLLPKTLSEIIAKDSDYQEFYDVRYDIKNAFINVVNTDQQIWHNITLQAKNRYYNTNGYNIMLNFSSRRNQKAITINNDSFSLNFQRSDNIELILNNQNKLDLKPFFANTLKHYQYGPDIKGVDSIATEGDLGKYHLKIYFSEISKSNYGDETSYDFGELYIFIKEK